MNTPVFSALAFVTWVYANYVSPSVLSLKNQSGGSSPVVTCVSSHQCLSSNVDIILTYTTRVPIRTKTNVTSNLELDYKTATLTKHVSLSTSFTNKLNDSEQTFTTNEPMRIDYSDVMQSDFLCLLSHAQNLFSISQALWRFVSLKLLNFQL